MPTTEYNIELQAVTANFLTKIPITLAQLGNQSQDLNVDRNILTVSNINNCASFYSQYSNCGPGYYCYEPFVFVPISQILN